MYVIGRSLMGIYFLLPGLVKFLAWDKHLQLMQDHSIPMAPFLLAITAVIEIIAGIGLIAGKFTQLFSLVLFVLVIIINFQMHDFWNFTDMIAAHEQQNFFKNMGISGGLLLLANFTGQSLTKGHL